MPKRTADTLERGDVVRFEGHRWVVLEPSDTVVTAPQDQIFHDRPARECCEPRIGLLGGRGLLTHHVTYVIWPNTKQFTVREFLDLEIRSARPEPHPEDKA